MYSLRRRRGSNIEYRLRVRVEGGHRVPSTFILGQKRDQYEDSVREKLLA